MSFWKNAIWADGDDYERVISLEHVREILYEKGQARLTIMFQGNEENIVLTKDVAHNAWMQINNLRVLTPTTFSSIALNVEEAITNAERDARKHVEALGYQSNEDALNGIPPGIVHSIDTQTIYISETQSFLHTITVIHGELW